MNNELRLLAGTLLLGSFLLLGCRSQPPSEEAQAQACDPTVLVLSNQRQEYPRDEITGTHLNTVVSGEIAVVGCREQLERFNEAHILYVRGEFKKLMEKHGFGFLLGSKAPKFRKEVAAAINATGEAPQFADYFLFYWSYGEQFDEQAPVGE